MIPRIHSLQVAVMTGDDGDDGDDDDGKGDGGGEEEGAQHEALTVDLEEKKEAIV